MVFIAGPIDGVIPAKLVLEVLSRGAGIHVFQDLKWTPAFAGVTVIRDITNFEIGSSVVWCPINISTLIVTLNLFQGLSSY